MRLLSFFVDVACLVVTAGVFLRAHFYVFVCFYAFVHLLVYIYLSVNQLRNYLLFIYFV